MLCTGRFLAEGEMECTKSLRRKGEKFILLYTECVPHVSREKRDVQKLLPKIQGSGARSSCCRVCGWIKYWLVSKRDPADKKTRIVFIPPIVPWSCRQILPLWWSNLKFQNQGKERERAEIKKGNFLRYQVWTEEQILEQGSISSKNKPKHWTLWPRAPSVQEVPPFKECKLHNEWSPALSFMDSRKLLQRAGLWPGLRAGNN